MENHQFKKTLKQIHQFIAKLLRTFDLKNDYLDKDDTFVRIL